MRGIKESAEQFETLITKETMWGLPRGNVKLLRGRVTVLDAARAISEAARRSDVDGLFVYLCAHGRRWTGDHVTDRGLHFALSDSPWDLPFNHLPFATVREMLSRESKAAATVLIIDSCYADGSFLSGADPLQPPSIPGVCTLISTKRRVPADSSWPDTSYTAFSGALIQIIEKGIPGPAEYLTPDAIFPELCRRLRAYPEPDMRVSGTSVFLCKNNEYRPVTNELERDELLARLDRPEAVDPAAYATAVEHALGPDGERDDAKQLITAFGTNRPAEHLAIHTALWKMATGCEISGLTQTILGMRARTQETNSVRAAVNTNAIVEVAAGHREAAEIAELVAKFAGKPGAEYLARLALDAAAAQRATTTLAALAGELRRHGLLNQAATLLAAVVRRRLPRAIARLLADLSTRNQTELVGLLIDSLARDDRVFVILCLRADDRLDLAERASKRMATFLAPDELADLIRGLHAHQDGGSVDVVIRGALDRDLDQLAELIGTLSANRDDSTVMNCHEGRERCR